MGFGRPVAVALLALAAVALWTCVNAGSASAATGDLTLQQCIEDNDVTADAACTPDVDGLNDATGVAVSADGTSVYAVAPGDDAVVNFNRNTSTGALTFSQCFNDDEQTNEAACTDVNGLDGARGIAISADGTSVVVAAANSGAGDDAIVNFNRNTGTGALAFSQCFQDKTDSPTDEATCTTQAGLNGASGVAISTNGASVYVASRDDDSVSNFNRNTGTGALTFSQCFDDPGNDAACTDTNPLAGANGVAVSPDGASVYAAAPIDDVVANFTRNTTTGALTFSECFDDPSQEAACTDTAGLGGASGVAVSPDGVSLYAASSNLVGGTGDDDAVVNFNRNTGTGALTFSQCFEDTGKGTTCTDTGGLDGATAVAVGSENGSAESVYVAAGGDSAIVNLDRNATTGALGTPNCYEDAGQPGGQQDCTNPDPAGLETVAGVATSNDGKSVYSASIGDDAVDNFDRQGQPAISINDVTQAEGNSGDTAFNFTVSLNHASAQTVTVAYATSNGTATLVDNDYDSASGTVTFVPGDVSETVTVNVNGDTTDEPNENFNVDLSSPTKASIADSQGVGTITNDDDPAISINDVTVTEGDSGETDATFTVSLNHASNETVTVNWATSNGTATIADGDYDSNSGTVTFTGTDTSETVTVKVNGDIKDEPDETFNVNLSGNSSNSSILDGTGVGTITDDDPAPSISIDDISVTEGNAGTTNAVFTVTLSNPSSQTVTVDFDTSDGTATQPLDYSSHSETVSFSPGDTSKQVTVQVNGDLIDEPDETFNGDLSNASSSATIADAQGVATITDDDGAPTVSVDDVSEDEGDSGTTNFDFTVSLSNPSAAPVTVEFDTSDGTATVADNDYNARSQTVTFVPLDTEETVTVTVNGDTTDEPDEVFDVDLSEVSATATIGDGDGDGTIVNDDDPAISINDPTVTEGDSGTTNASFDVTLDSPSNETVTVDFDTSDGTATDADNDYEPHSETVTFTGTDTSETVSVAVNGDTADEADEVFHGDLSNAANATIADNQGDATITNDDDPAISIGDVSQAEGDSGTSDFDFTVSLDRPSNDDVTVDFTTTDGTATTGDDDYESETGTVTFTGGSTSETVSVEVNGDTKDESDEGFTVDLSNASANSSIADGQGDGTITNDDTDPAISIDDVSQAEGDTGQTDFDFEVTLSNPSDQQITVDYATSNGTATTGDGDYDSKSGTVTFSPGDDSETVTVKVNGDDKDESDETFNVDLSNASSNSSILDNQGVGTIQNDDPDPDISIGDLSAAEGNSGETDFDFAVTLSNPSDQTITVDYATADDTATTADGDYDAKTGTVTFNPGDTSETVTVKVNGDDKDESDETFDVGLSNNSSNSAINDGTGVGTIQNDDADPAISIDDVSHTEGDSGEKDFDFTVSLSNPSDQTITVDYATADDSATTADSDYDSASDTVTFNPGDTSETLTVKVNGDTTDEPDETFDVNLTNNSSNSSILDGTGVGTITNDDDPAISINDVTVTEGDSGETDATFTVSLNHASNETVTVNWATSNGTATIADGDYDAVTSGTVTFTGTDTSETVTVKVNGDIKDEPDETFHVNLTSPTNSTIADSQGVGTITDDDDPPLVSIADAGTLDEGDTGQTPASFVVTLDNPSGKTVTVDFASADGSATTGDGDYDENSDTLTFAPGEDEKTVTVDVNGDTKHEPNETFGVNLSNESNATIDDGSGDATISNDDAAPTISIADTSLPEGNSGDTPFGFSVTLSNPSSQQVTVDFAASDGTATQPGDYDPGTGTVTFPAGDTSETASVNVNGDTGAEPDEAFNVNLTNNSSNSSILDNQGLGTIVDDDTLPTPPTVPGPPAGDQDPEPPNTTITGGPKAKTKKKDASFTFTGTDARAVASFECKLDGGSFQPCSSPKSVRVKKGTHTFQVRAIDAAGNTDPTPATQSWTVKKKKKKKN